MTYQEWFNTHARKHANIMTKLTHLSDDEVIRYFRFENMVQEENDFCLLYATNTRCHETLDLNCYLCACPHFRFNDTGLGIKEGKTLFSLCAIDAPHGGQFCTDTAIHHDCTGCLIPHREGYIRKVFDREWLVMMKNC
jgi:Zn-finger protein